MSEKLERIKREVRADLQLMWAGQADGNKRITRIAEKIEEHSFKIEAQGAKIEEQGKQIAAHGKQIAEHSKQIGTSMRETAQIGREVAALGDQMVGRLKQFDHRFGTFLDAIAEDVEQRAPLSRVESLEKRVQKLEEGRGPAA